MTHTTDEDKGDSLQTDRTEAVDFGEVLTREIEEIQRSRELREPKQQEINERAKDKAGKTAAGKKFSYQQAHDEQLLGLALSGGGIRSATFNLGVLQGLAELRLLKIFDYLSTVSGGGYIGAWLTAWIQRVGIEQVSDELGAVPADRTVKNGTHGAPEVAAVRFLRSYSNYLTPQLGLLSSDTWTLVAVYLRNFLLNLIILVATFTTVLLAPRLILLGTKFAVQSHQDYRLNLLVILFLGTLGLAFTALNLRFSPPQGKETDPWYTQPKWIRRGAVSPLFLAAVLASWSLFQFARDQPGQNVLLQMMEFSALLYTLSWVTAWLLSLFLGRRAGTAPAAASWGVLNTTAAPAGALGGLLLWAVYCLFIQILRCSPEATNWSPLVVLASFGPPLVVAVFLLTAFLHMGLAGQAFPDGLREWMSRVAGWFLIYALGWSCLFLVALFSPLLIEWTSTWGRVALGSAWVGSTLAGVLAGKSAKTNGTKSRNPLIDIVAKIGPPVFVIGLLVALSLGIDSGLFPHSTPQPPPAVEQRTLVLPLEREGEIRVPIGIASKAEVPSGFEHQAARIGETLEDPTRLWILLAAALAAALLFSWRVDVNEFSMHLLYRNRLARCYLGASTKRRPHPFTGFYADDDLLLSRLRTAPLDYEPPYEGPYPILNAAINLVRGRNLAWQERKAASFVFTPLFSGFDLPVAEEAADCPEEDRQDRAFRRTSTYGYADGGVYLGTAMAISGAAASPNSGYHSSPALTFLMTVFNVRLGWWLGNPRGPRWRQASPPGGPLYLLGELTGRTNDESDFVYLSDGGHFENLGVYELVKRRCRMIVACDATQDGDFSFSDLGNAIRKCRTDLGIDIEINTDSLERRSDSGFSTWHCAVGKIRYDRIDPSASPGTLLYLKPSLTGDEPTDLLNYRSRNPAFPHQSTGDQFFAESQFESYRKLGFHIVQQIFQGALRQSDAVHRQHPGGHNEGLIAALKERWYPPSREVADDFPQFTETLDKLYERMRTDDKLRFLDGQFYPEWRRLQEKAFSTAEGAPPTESWLPKDAEQIRAGFYLCSSLIQLMEDIYLALDLDQEADHPDNRGWINLFKHWSWSGMLRVTWAVSACTYGIRFQRFCERDLGLGLGEVQSELSALPASLEELKETLKKEVDDERLNPVEQNWILDVYEEFGTAGEQLVTFSLAVKPPLAFGSGKQDKDIFSFVFGFALIREKALLYLRIQDHLRKMGLAREALKQLVQNRKIEKLDLVAADRTRARDQGNGKDQGKDHEKQKTLYLFGETDCQRCLRLFKSVRLEAEEARQDPEAEKQALKAARMGENVDKEAAE